MNKLFWMAFLSLSKLKEASMSRNVEILVDLPPILKRINDTFSYLEYKNSVKIQNFTNIKEIKLYARHLIFDDVNPVSVGGGLSWPPPSKISSCSSGIAFWVTQVGWQFLSTLILGGNICFWAKNYLEKVLEYHFWGKGHFSRAMKGIFLKLQSYVKGQKRGFWGWPT